MMNPETVKQRVFKQMDLESSLAVILIVGLGVTGISVARFLKNIGVDFSLIDSRKQPPNLSQIK
ncbi:MAG: UDP-N-acetylmuramoyl-L-alanine--D-glutamate ligase, partial [Methylococcales bacterium]|nr:UDP-N-acetylmuramoyl-L-alanine--D-glutamate ligase [Methylococcales bacterium]MBT4664013.1 UDP-N-acetylmuramoyl-L-alanine--D-glutamate ligase [Methylococcales bacterium]